MKKEFINETLVGKEISLKPYHKNAPFTGVVTDLTAEGKFIAVDSATGKKVEISSSTMARWYLIAGAEATETDETKQEEAHDTQPETAAPETPNEVKQTSEEVASDADKKPTEGEAEAEEVNQTTKKAAGRKKLEVNPEYQSALDYLVEQMKSYAGVVITKHPIASSIGFKVDEKKAFMEAYLQRDCLNLLVCYSSEIENLKGKLETRRVPETHMWITDTYIKVHNIDELNIAMPAIKASADFRLTTPTRRTSKKQTETETIKA